MRGGTCPRGGCSRARAGCGAAWHPSAWDIPAGAVGQEPLSALCQPLPIISTNPSYRFCAVYLCLVLKGSPSVSLTSCLSLHFMPPYSCIMRNSNQPIPWLRPLTLTVRCSCIIAVLLQSLWARGSWASLSCHWSFSATWFTVVSSLHLSFLLELYSEAAARKKQKQKKQAVNNIN